MIKNRWWITKLKIYPLIEAALNDHKDAVILLLRHGASTKDILYAIDDLSLSMIQLLLDYKANTNIRLPRCGDTRKLLLLLDCGLSIQDMFNYSIVWNNMIVFDTLRTNMK